jgi:hypothetical protein
MGLDEDIARHAAGEDVDGAAVSSDEVLVTAALPSFDAAGSLTGLAALRRLSVSLTRRPSLDDGWPRDRASGTAQRRAAACWG